MMSINRESNQSSDCQSIEMADLKRSRAAQRGLRTRERTIHLHGPIVRMSAKDKENIRIENGTISLNEAYAGVPNRGEFLKQAHLFERDITSKKTDRAFIVPDGLDTIQRGSLVTLFWYRRDQNVTPLLKDDVTTVHGMDGERYELRAAEDVVVESDAKLKSQSFIRSCTGFARFEVN